MAIAGVSLLTPSRSNNLIGSIKGCFTRNGGPRLIGSLKGKSNSFGQGPSTTALLRLSRRAPVWEPHLPFH